MSGRSAIGTMAATRHHSLFLQMRDTWTKKFLKPPELAVRRLTLKWISAKRPQQLQSELPLQLPPKPKILLLRQDRLGDAIISTPLIVALREKFPNAELMMLLGTNNESI